MGHDHPIELGAGPQNGESAASGERYIDIDVLKRSQSRRRRKSGQGGGGRGGGPGDASGPPPDDGRPSLIMQPGNLAATAKELLGCLSRAGGHFCRGGLARVHQAPDAAPSIQMMDEFDTINDVLHIVQTKEWRKAPGDDEFRLIDRTPPRMVAKLILSQARTSNHGLPPLNGITTAPLLGDDGEIICGAAGYHAAAGMWRSDVPDLQVPIHPSGEQASTSLRILRKGFRTFSFGDSDRVMGEDGIERVDQTIPPGADESAFLVALLTAACRPSLDRAPGLAVTAPTSSGSGAGKGLLVNSVGVIAYRVLPNTFIPSHAPEEFDKQLGAVFVTGDQMAFLDNVNRPVASSLLASATTELSVRVRMLGESRMMELRPRTFIAIAGNGLKPGEDLARRFLLVELDPRCEDPESRPFPDGFLDSLARRRGELLGALMTIWRWGRQNQAALRRGRPLGSFQRWADWCRDPLLTLGCADPVERMRDVKAADPHRRRIGEIFTTWWHVHRDFPMRASELAPDVRDAIDPQGRGRQFVASQVEKLAGTRGAGFVLEAQRGNGKWSVTTYQLRETEAPTASAVEGLL